MDIEETTQTALAEDLRHLADMVEGDPTVAAHIINQIAGGEISPTSRLLVPVMYDEAPVGALQAFIRSSIRVGATVTKDYSDNYGAADILFPGGLRLHVYANRDQVCRRIVKGTREVTREVKDPAALEAVPTVTVTETVEDVEWVCEPLLADA